MRSAAIALCLALSACAAQPKPPVGVPAVADPCPAEGLAPVQAEPQSPVTDPTELGGVYGAIAGVLGPDRAQALIRFWEADRPAWGRRGWERVKVTKTWCERPPT